MPPGGVGRSHVTSQRIASEPKESILSPTADFTSFPHGSSAERAVHPTRPPGPYCSNSRYAGACVRTAEVSAKSRPQTLPVVVESSVEVAVTACFEAKV